VNLLKSSTYSLDEPKGPIIHYVIRSLAVGVLYSSLSILLYGITAIQFYVTDSGVEVVRL
jgi:hypothetical protein